MKLRTLRALIENHGYHNLSIQWIKSQYPELAEAIDATLLEQEEYEMMGMIQRAERVEKQYIIFVNKNVDVLLIPNKEHYPRSEWVVISETSRIPLEEFEAIFQATS